VKSAKVAPPPKPRIDQPISMTTPTPVLITTPSLSTVPGASQATTRDVSLEITDTAMGTLIPINLGRFMASFKIVHFDIIANRYVEMVVLIGEGPIDGIETVSIDSTQVYPTPPTWMDSIVLRTGTLDQQPPGNITNATIAQLAWPGFAYLSMRLDLQTAPINGGLPRVEVAGRGLLGWNYATDPTGAPDFPVEWTENPMALLMLLMRSPDFGCGLPRTALDALESGVGTSWYDSCLGCDAVVDRLLVQSFGNTNSDTAASNSADRAEAFTAINDSFALQVKIQVLDHSLDGKGWNDIFQLRTSPFGAAQTLYPIVLPGGASPGWTCSTDLSTFPVIPTPISGPGDYYLTAWYGNDVAQEDQGRVYVSGTTYYLVMPANAGCKWYMNTLTNVYPGGNAMVRTPAWVGVNYDYWFRTAVAEKMFRLEYTVAQRQPIEQVVTPILQVCNGRWGLWDGLYRVSLDHLAAGSLLLSDQESDNPDILLVQDTMQGTRSSPEIPNCAIAEFIDTVTWDRAEVKVLWDTVQEGLDQLRELRFSCLPFPSGDQAWRLLSTWLARGRRTWHAACSTAQHGIRLHPGMLVQLKSRLFSTTKTMIVDTVTDNAHGTFDLSLFEYSVDDFVLAAYVPQTVVTTITQLPS